MVGCKKGNSMNHHYLRHHLTPSIIIIIIIIMIMIIIDHHDHDYHWSSLLFCEKNKNTKLWGQNTKSLSWSFYATGSQRAAPLVPDGAVPRNGFDRRCFQVGVAPQSSSQGRNDPSYVVIMSWLGIMGFLYGIFKVIFIGSIWDFYGD